MLDFGISQYSEMYELINITESLYSICAFKRVKTEDGKNLFITFHKEQIFSSSFEVLECIKCKFRHW